MVPQDPLPGPEDVPHAIAARTLTRSTTDKHITGVAGGLGRYFGIDPIIFRVAFGAATLVSGLGIVAYIALSLVVPKDTGEPAWITGRSKATTIALAAVLGVIVVTSFSKPAFVLGPGLFVLAAVSLAGLGLYRLLGGSFRDDPAKAIARASLAIIALAAMLGAATGIGLIAALGGGVAVAIISVVAGLGLVTAGLLGGPRWLIVPAIVLVLPLAVVSASDFDLTGGVGERSYRPATVAQLRPEYKLGVGQMRVDLRSLDLPAGTTTVKLRLGVGEALVKLPGDACVATSARIGVGEADLPSGSENGTSVEASSGNLVNARLRVIADVDVGHVQVDGGSTCA